MLQDNRLRLHSLDALRGIASLSVIFWHWQIFYMGISSSVPFRVEAQPLFNYFFLFYRSGYLAVDLFFVLSGFIFFWLYAKSIYHGHVSVLDFFVRRFSRLYPLHFLTLLIVTMEQIHYWHLTGTYLAYPKNDAFHFILNLFFISSIGLEKGYSFNAPIWSVSVEMVLYFLFFVICKTFKVNKLLLAGISILGIFWIFPFYQPVGRGVGTFFLGGFSYYIFEAIVKSKHSKLISNLLLALSLLSWATVIFLIANNYSLEILKVLAGGTATIPAMLLFSLTILTLAILENERKLPFEKFSFLGNISYSCYLLHFPLQLLFAIAMYKMGFSSDIFNHKILLITFFLVLIPLSLASYHYVEMPLQQYFRQRWLRFINQV